MTPYVILGALAILAVVLLAGRAWNDSSYSMAFGSRDDSDDDEPDDRGGSLMTPATAAEPRELIVMDTTGDTKIIWDPDKPEEVEHARQTFNTLRAKGYAAYSVNKKGDKGEVIREFDPHAEKMILAPAMVGG